MHTSTQFKLATLMTLVLSTFTLSKSAIATTFSNQEVDQNRLIAIASPYGNNAHQLLILEQLSNTRPCWNEQGGVVDPLLLKFDFTGICSRNADSNAYSLRIANEDLAWRYSLRVVNRQGQLVLVATSNQDRTVPDLEVGRATPVDNGFSKISLNPGWRFTKRVYNNQVQSHVYLTHDQPLDHLIAMARASQPPAPPPILSSPVVSRPPGIVVPGLPPASAAPPPGVVVPTLPLPQPTIPSLPPPTLPIPPSSGVVVPTIPSNNNSAYRVIVPAPTLTVQNRVKQLVPEAFRTTLSGQSVMQAGLFREMNKANEVYQLLAQNNLPARIVPADISTIPPAPTPGNPSSPAPRGRVVVVIDPGHGGRDPGAVGIGGLREKDVVFSISQQVTSLLEQEGIQVVMTRRDDREVDLAPRVQLAQRSSADIFVSIHANAINMSRPDVNGLETYYYHAASRRLADVIHSNLLREVGMRDRGVRRANFFVVRRTSMPAVLVEVGFVTGREDAARLANPAERTRIAQGIARGILQYVRSSGR